MLGRTLALLFILLFLTPEPGHSATCDIAGFCQGELLRIESAFAAGMDKAVDDEERSECLRLRNAALTMLVERTYQAILSWMADRRDLLDILQSDQGRWQGSLDAVVRRGDGGIPALEEVSQLLLDRLRTFTAIASGTIFAEFEN